MTKTTILEKKSQKPTDFEVFLKYGCPKCGQEHWIKYLQASTKNFKVVCDCGVVFKVKQVVDFKVRYQQTSKKDHSKSNTSVPVDILKQCVTILTGYGLDKNEAHALISKAYNTNPVDSVVELVKHSLVLMRE